MSLSPFDPTRQSHDLDSKLLAGLERLSQVFKMLLTEKAFRKELSPIQAQILLFIRFHHQDLATVSYLAKEFGLTKPTLSDAIHKLEEKQLVEKKSREKDSRSFHILLTEKGAQKVREIEGYTEPVLSALRSLDIKAKSDSWALVFNLINQLNKAGIITAQRMCFGCRYYRSKGETHFCNLLNQPLATTEIRLDCPEFEPAF